MRKLRRKRAAALGVVVAVVAAGSAAAALQQLPSGGQVNSTDPAAGIDQTKGVDGGEPTNADVVGGALVAGAPGVPWATFRAHETPSKDQIFVRSFIKTGVWKTQGSGTVGGKSSASPTFHGSLNFDQGQDGEVPAIDFAGTGRTVPWATWYEDTSAFAGKKQIFASRFDKTTGNWIFGGQGRGVGSETTVVPSLNIRTNQDAENPSVAGGSAVDPTKPGPWVTWQETTSSPVSGKDQIFVSRPLGPGQPANSCDATAVLPAGTNDGSGHVPIDGGFCWQQTGVQRVGPSAADPSLNIDPTRNGIEPDIAFTGSSDHVPWVVWYEKDAGTLGLHTNEMVFAAKGLAVSPTIGNGGFNWTAVGQSGSGLLDTTGGTHHFGACAETSLAEEGCSLNKNVNNDAEDPRVAAGTMNPLNATVPWVVWDETVAGVKQVFVSRLVGTNFQIANNGQPISLGANDSTRPDITFSGNTPYVSWREDEGGVTKLFVGHFINAANPTFVLDSNTTTIAPTGTGAGQADVRSPISSGCIADPFNQDGANCTGSAIGTPFFLFTTATGSLLNLLADAYQPGTPVTNAGATGITQTSGVVTGSVDPQGASVATSFDYGLTSSYERGNVPASPAKTGTDGVTAFSAALTGLPPGTVVHFRAVATSDFAPPVDGPDQTFTTSSPPPPPPADGHASIGHASVSGTTASVKASCTGNPGDKCKLTFKLTVTETVLGHRIIAVSSRAHKHKVVVNVGSVSAALTAGQSKTVKIQLNGTGKNLLKALHKLQTTLTVTQKLLNGHSRTVNTQKVTFTAPKKKHHH